MVPVCRDRWVLDWRENPEFSLGKGTFAYPSVVRPLKQAARLVLKFIY